ncbi:MAG TPA: hypothetical protein VIV12_20540 [Streptosporangiaceae bacterium]
MAIDSLCFADHDPVTGPPNPNDGFTGIEDAGVITSEAEPGYVLGDRLNLGAAGVGTGSGFPPAIFQCVKNGDYLNLAFFCRFDLSFDDEDVIVLAVKPSASAPQTEARRIDIFPVFNGIGANDPATCSGGTCPDDPPKPGQPSGTDYHMRTRPPRLVKHFRGQSGTPPWTTLNQGGATYTGPNNLTVMARSWTPPVPTGDCPECAWSIEVQVPRTKGLGGNNWIDLPDSFAIYFNIMRVKDCDHTVCPNQAVQCPPGTKGVVQFKFPVGSADLTGVLGAGTSIPVYGTGFIPSLQSPVGSNCGQGVKFINGENSVGVRPTTAPAGSAPGSTIVGPSGTTDNRLVAQVENTSTDPGGDAPGVTAEFRFANWGMGPSGFTSWAPASGASPMPTNPTMIAHGNSAELTSEWPHASVPSKYSASPHQCVWVQLDTHQTPPGVPVNFIQSSVRRNLDFVNLSRREDSAEISGVGYPAPPRGRHHDFLLETNVRQIVLRGEGDGGEGDGEDRHRVLLTRVSRETPAPEVIWLWIVHGYRRTGQTIEIEGSEYEILDDAPGSFGYVAAHDNIEDVLTHRLSGGGIRHEGGNFYSLRVPVDGSVTVQTHVSAAARDSGEPPVPRGWLRWLLALLLRLLRALVRWIRRLLHR